MWGGLWTTTSSRNGLTTALNLPTVKACLMLQAKRQRHLHNCLNALFLRTISKLYSLPDRTNSMWLKTRLWPTEYLVWTKNHPRDCSSPTRKREKINLIRFFLASKYLYPSTKRSRVNRSVTLAISRRTWSEFKHHWKRRSLSTRASTSVCFHKWVARSLLSWLSLSRSNAETRIRQPNYKKIMKTLIIRTPLHTWLSKWTNSNRIRRISSAWTLKARVCTPMNAR